MVKIAATAIKHKIMVVDDDPMVGECLAKFLGKSGYEVTYLSSGKQALECLETSQFNLLITDMNMPEMCGSELIKLVKGIRPDLPVMVMTGSKDDKTADEIAELDVRCCFSKPFNFDSVACTIRDTLAPTQNNARK